ncbi:putative chitinase [Helianthus annuus]|nr:putative chitinase [Helianthus annuus]KAJ0916159.1 putative chitinase [Helianthus annuus]
MIAFLNNLSYLTPVFPHLIFINTQSSNTVNSLIKMGFSKFHIVLFTLLALVAMASASSKSDLFREYIGAEFNNVKFSDVPINPNVEFHYVHTRFCNRLHQFIFFVVPDQWKVQCVLGHR